MLPISVSLPRNSLPPHSIANGVAPDQKHLASLPMSDTTSPRFGSCRGPVDALLAGAKISECGALQSSATGDCDNKNDGVSLTPTAPARR
jgi:hypothetical protein